jgi:hypothetical protein
LIKVGLKVWVSLIEKLWLATSNTDPVPKPLLPPIGLKE